MVYQCKECKKTVMRLSSNGLCSECEKKIKDKKNSFEYIQEQIDEIKETQKDIQKSIKLIMSIVTKKRNDK